MMDTLHISDVIQKYISGDWGEDVNVDTFLVQVACVRGADINDLNAGVFNNLPIRYITSTSLSKKGLQEGCIVIEKSGGSPTQSTGRVAYISKECIAKHPNVVCSNFCEAFSIKPEWDSKYIFYYLQYFYNTGVFFNFEGKTSGLHNLDIEHAFKSIPIKRIDIQAQKRIASILSALDQKIALNRSIDAKLEALARQLYDYWFVQFDFPDANGKPYKSSGGEMVYNEKLKREIPEGWTSTSLSNILDVLKDGTHNPPQRCAEGVPLLTGTMFGDLFLDYTKATYISFEDYNEIHKKYQPQENDIIITKIGTIGNINLLRKSDIPIAIHCNSALLRFKKMYNGPYALLFCKSKLFYSRLYATKGQSIQEFVSLDKIANVPVECPSQEVLEAFNNMLKPIICKLEKNQEEITSLTRQRDELLPLLMNGQVTVK